MKNNKKKLKAPKLRFPEFTDDWEKCSLNKFTEYESSNYSISQFNECNLSGKYKVFDVNKEIACIDEFDQLNEYISIIKDGAGIGRTEIRPEKSSVIGTMGYIKSINSDIYFVYSLIKNVKWNKYKNGSTIPHVYYKDYGNEKFFIPNKDEQAKIGKFFKEIDRFITLNQNKISHIKDLKAGLLQKMFPKNGETKPEIRFDGFTDDWEEFRFGKIYQIRRGLTYKPSDVQETGIRVLRSSNINEDTFVLRSDDVFVKSKSVNIDEIKNGDILITSANGSSRLVGKHAIINGIDNKTVHGGFMLVASTDNPQFVNALMSSNWYSKFINIFVSGGNGAIGNLSKSHLENQKILIPELSEQQKIGEFFSQLDNLLTLYKRKVEHLQEQKKSLLKQMFI